MSGSSPNSDFNFLEEMLCFFVFFVLFSCFQLFKKKNNWIGGTDWIWGMTNPSFSRIFGFFLLDKTPKYSIFITTYRAHRVVI